MKYAIKGGKVVNIPDKDLERSMKTMGLSRDEAIQLWLEDEGYEVNAEQQALEDKAKANRITATIHQAKKSDKPKTQSERVKKPDPTKEGIIAAIADLLPQQGATDVKITNAGKYIEFKARGEWFTVNLIRNTKKNKTEKEGGGK